MRQFQAKDLNNTSQSIRIDKDPDTCPICHHSISPIILSNTYLIRDNNLLEVAYKCPRLKCSHMFIGQFNNSHANRGYLYARSLPKTIKEINIEDEIKEISPNFEKIYNQAIHAEAYGLDEVSGVALRKAFEFLIKDFCISKHPEKGEEIKKIFLGQCIKNYIDDVKIKKCAERAVWLGNDETHYVRNWENHDIKDLKLLIRLSINWVINDLLTEKYLNDMN